MPKTAHRRPKAREDDPLLQVVLGAMPLWAVVPAIAVGAGGVYLLGLAFHLSAGLSRSVAMFFIAIAVLAAVAGQVERAKTRKRLVTTTKIEHLRAMTWQEFECLALSAYKALGYGGSLTQRGSDGGVDIILSRDGRRTYVQCKQRRWETIGPDPIRSLRGVVAGEGFDHGIFVTSGRYTAEALAVAKAYGIETVDGPGLLQLLGEARGDVPSVVIADSAAVEPSPTCPRCQAVMARRTGPRGEFWGCSQFPKCRGTREIG